MSFDNDVFFSYAHLDNESFIEGQPGWISNFERALKVRLGQLLGREARVWRDPKLQGNDFFGDTLLEQLPNVATLVTVLSPRYVNSEWCLRELNSFWEAATHRQGNRIGNKARVFKVVKTPVALDRHPTQLQPLLGYEFFAEDPETGRMQELDQALGPEAQRQYYLKVDDLAHDICALLETPPADEHTPDEARPDTGELQVVPEKTVYLAETSSDLQDQRQAIKRYLQRHGCTVLPEQPLPFQTAGEFSTSVRSLLARCRLSIHPIGRNFGIVPDGTSQSVVALQNELSMERTDEGLHRLLWIPGDHGIEDSRQQSFIDALRNDTRLDLSTDILQTGLEELKDALGRIMDPPQAAPPNRPDGEVPDDDLRRVYLICDERDLENTVSLEDCLFDQGLEVITPLFEGDESQMRLEHEDNLKVCDAVIVYYGQGSEMWQRRKFSELRKCAGQGRSKPLLGKALYVAPPDTSAKARLRTREAEVIREVDGFVPASLDSFLAQLKPAETRLTG